MARPSAVKQAAERSRELAAKALERSQAAPSDPEDFLRLADQEPGNGEGTPEGTPPEPPTPPQPPAAPETPDWKAKFEAEQAERTRLENAYRTLRGKYDAEVPRLADRVRELETKQEKAEQAREVESLGREANENLQRIIAEAKDQIPEDIVDQVYRLAEHIVEAKLAARGKPADTPDPDRIEELEKRLDALSHMTREQQLTALVPNWRDIDNMPEWYSYLSKEDPHTGYVRQTVLDDHWQRGNVAQVAKMFIAFQESRQQPAGPPLDQHVEPEAGAGTTEPVTRQARTWRRSEIAQINAMERQGRFRGREKELKALRRDIELAASEGRVVEG